MNRCNRGANVRRWPRQATIEQQPPTPRRQRRLREDISKPLRQHGKTGTNSIQDMNIETKHQSPCMTSIKATSGMSLSFEMFPLEISSLVFELIEREDLCHFRLTCRKHAEIGRHLIPRYGLVIPCISTIFEELAVLKHRDITANVKKLTLLSCHWYWVSDKRERDADSIVAAIIMRAVQLFPNLEVIVPTYHHFWHEEASIERFMTKTSAFPHRNRILPPLPLNGILRGLSSSHNTNIRCLDLSHHTPVMLEDFKPLDHGTLGSFSVIEYIHFVLYERVGAGMNHEFRERRRHELSDVLRLFPSLRGLHIEVREKKGGPVRMGHGYMDLLSRVIGDNVWHRLESVYLSYIWCTEDQLFEFLRNHAGTLKSFGLGDVCLLDGDWGSFFRRLSILNAQGLISLRWLRLDGRLAGYRDFFIPSIDSVLFRLVLPLQLLANYLEDISMDWSLVKSWNYHPHVNQLPGKYRIQISESAYKVVEIED